MIPSVSESRTDGLTSFARLSRYLTHEREGGSEAVRSRGPVLLSDNLLSLETAATEMKLAAGQSTRVKDPVLHFQLSWKPGEQPNEQEWQKSAKKAIGALGFEEHQFMVVAHDDKAHFHIHVVINRVHPETQLAHNPRLSLLTLHRTARELEQEFGRGEAPGLYRWDPAENRAVRVSREERNQNASLRSQAELPANARAARMARFNDNESLHAFAAGQPARELRKLLTQQASWQEVHRLLGRHGLTLQAGEKGGYTVGAEYSAIKVKASDVFRFAFSGKEARAQTEKALGTFEAREANSPFAPPKIDYTHTFTREERYSHANAVLESRAAKSRKSVKTKSLDDLRSLSRIGVVPGNQYDQVLLQALPAPHLRDGKPKEYLRVRRGGLRESQAGAGRITPFGQQAPTNNQPARSESPAETKAARAAVYKQQREGEARQRRTLRLAERQQERTELKAEYHKAAAAYRVKLREYTHEAQKQRRELTEGLKREKASIRSAGGSPQLRRALVSQAIVEHLIARAAFNEQTASARAAVERPTYRGWVEAKAQGGDKRAVAQMRGWRYQDQRTLRQIESESADSTRRAGILKAARDADDEVKGEIHDWQTLANQRLQELREQSQNAAALRSIRWKTNLATGDVIYTLAGIVSLVDRGKNITVLKHDLDATKIALEIAVHKYGRTLEVQGSDIFKKQLIQAAVQQNLQVSFTDQELQAKLVTARNQQKLQKQHDSVRLAKRDRDR